MVSVGLNPEECYSLEGLFQELGVLEVANEGAECLTEAELQQLLRAADKDIDGSASVVDFARWLQQEDPKVVADTPVDAGFTPTTVCSNIAPRDVEQLDVQQQIVASDKGTLAKMMHQIQQLSDIVQVQHKDMRQIRRENCQLRETVSTLNSELTRCKQHCVEMNSNLKMVVPPPMYQPTATELQMELERACAMRDAASAECSRLHRRCIELQEINDQLRHSAQAPQSLAKTQRPVSAPSSRSRPISIVDAMGFEPRQNSVAGIRGRIHQAGGRFVVAEPGP